MSSKEKALEEKACLLARALRNSPCACRVPTYRDPQAYQCLRCKALEEWEKKHA